MQCAPCAMTDAADTVGDSKKVFILDAKKCHAGDACD